jgi:peptidoglycan/LPS O-acetylase OafA/YrhL
MVQISTFTPIIALASNPFELLLIIKSFLATLLIGSFYSLDVFFWISGFFLVAANFKKKKTLFWAPYNILMRALRFWPVYLFVIFFTTYVLPLMGSGPRWFFTDMNNCRSLMW